MDLHPLSVLPPLAYWVDSLDPYLLGSHFRGNFGAALLWVGYVAGFLAGAWLLYRYARAGRSLVPPEKVPDLMTAAILGVLIGGRLSSYLLHERLAQLHLRSPAGNLPRLGRRHGQHMAG